jgi:nucleoside-diphosphate-sugar epimerase
MKIMITGACGFLGRNLVRYLETTYPDLVLVDLPLDLFDTDVTSHWHQNHLVYHADINEDFSVVVDRMKGVDIVIHLANKSRIQASWTRYAEYYKTNITGSHKLFECAQNHGVKKFIYVSSSSVYGNSQHTAQKETDQLAPTNPYAISKAAAEWALTVQAEGKDTELIIVRPFTMYGDWMDYGDNALVIGKFIRAWQQGHPLMLDGGGAQTRDFLHATDAVAGLKLILEKGKHGDIFNLGTGESVTVKQLADCISNSQIVTPKRKGVVDHTKADITKLQALGYNPTIKVLDWLTDTVQELKLKENL